MVRVIKPRLTADEVAAILQVPKATLYQWRWKGYGPPAAKVGRGLRYDPDAFEAWLLAQEAAA